MGLPLALKGLIHRDVTNTDISNTDRTEQNALFNLSAPRVLYIGQAFRYSPENAFYIFNQQIYFII